VFFGGSGDDQAVTGTAYSALSAMHGGAGNDYLRGWASLDGGDGADILESYASGVDVTLSGGDGDDEVYAAQSYDPTDSQVSCGDGLDTVRLDLADAPPGDCEDVSYDIDGTDRADTIEGTPYDDFVRPGNGADTVRSYGGDDFVNGGNDTGGDVFWFGVGDDSIRQQDGNVDTIHCGPGYDRVTADADDVVADDCEFVGDFDF
jgi:Ca2+-binding RTX toxin-like protein